MQVNIADLIRPKFKVGQDVFKVERGMSGQLNNVRPVRIKRVVFVIEITHDREGNEMRATQLQYVDVRDGCYTEDSLIANLNDLTDTDCVPRVA